MGMRIDAHQHFWKFNTREYPWIEGDWPIRRDFLPADLQPLLQQGKFEASVAVQARQKLEETQWLLELSDQNPFIAGVVGWVDLRSRLVEEQLATLTQHPKFVGVRHVVQDEPDDRFLVGAHFLEGLGKLRQFGLAYDLLVFPQQLPAAIEVVRRFPDQIFILDHIAKPPIRQGWISPWRERMVELSQSPNIFCKVSGMVTEANWQRWKKSDFRRYLDVVFECFGVNRVVFGSDWPVCLLAASYSAVLEIVTEYSARLSPVDQEQLFGGNAQRCYRLKLVAQTAASTPRI